MRTIILLQFFILGFTQIFGQTLCNIPKNEESKILDCLFSDEEFTNNNKIFIKNNFISSCFRFSKFENKNITFCSEAKLYKELISNYYSIEKIDYSGNVTTIIITQRSNGAFLTYLLIKDIDDWKIQNKKKVNGRLKTDDFLYQSIRLKQKS